MVIFNKKIKSFENDKSDNKNNVKKYKKRKRCKIRTRTDKPWWLNRKKITAKKSIIFSSGSRHLLVKDRIKNLGLFIEKFIKINRFVRNEKNFRSNSKGKIKKCKKKFEFSRITKGFKKRKFYNGRRYREYKFASPIYFYKTLSTLFVSNIDVPRFYYVNYFGEQTRDYLTTKKGAWEKKEIRPSIFFKQLFKTMDKMDKARHNINKYKYVTNLKCNIDKLKRDHNWTQFDTKYPLKRVFTKMWYQIKNGAKTVFYNDIFRNLWIKNKYRKAFYKDKYLERWALAEALGNKPKKVIDKILKSRRRRDFNKKKRNLFPINFTDIEKHNNINFYKLYHQYYVEKKNVLSIFQKKNKYIFPRIKEYRIPSIFRYMNRKLKIKVGVKQTKKFYEELFSIKNWNKEKKEFFYVHYDINRIKNAKNFNEVTNSNIAVLENLINFYQNEYYEESICMYSKTKNWEVEEWNLMKERNLESYLSSTASDICDTNKKFFKVHKLYSATLNKKYRKIAFRKPKKPNKKPKKIRIRTFYGESSFRQRRLNTNWHNNIFKGEKTPMARFFSRHELTSRYPKNHRIFKNRLKCLSVNSYAWTEKEWLGLFHYFKRRLKKRRKKILTKIFFRNPRTATTRDAKVNLAKGTITYAKKTRTYHGRRLKPKFRWKKTWYRRYLKNTVKRWIFFSDIVQSNLK